MGCDTLHCAADPLVALVVLAKEWKIGDPLLALLAREWKGWKEDDLVWIGLPASI